MNNKDNHSTGSEHGGNFFSGFLLGVLIGAAVVFLLGTKKGKRLLKIVSEEGLGGISNILEGADETTDPDGAYKNPPSAAVLPKLRSVGDKASVNTEIKMNKSEKQGNLSQRKVAIKEKFAEEKPRIKRFFRGISRHVN